MRKTYAITLTMAMALTGAVWAAAVVPSHPRDYFRKGDGVPEAFTTGKTTLQRAQLPNVGPQRTTAGGTDLYGYAYYWDKGSNMTYGLYEFQTDGSFKLKWVDPRMSNSQLTTTGFYLDGSIYGYALSLADASGAPITGSHFVEIDFQSGKLLTARPVELDWEKGQPTGAMAYNPNDGYFYFYGFRNYTNTLMRSTVKKPNVIETVKSLSENIANEYMFTMAYCPEDRMFYGVNLNNQFVKMDTKGNQTVIAEVPDKDKQASYQIGLTWAPNEKVFYWNAIDNSDQSRIYTVTREGNFNLEGASDDNVWFSWFVTPEKRFVARAPETPEIQGVEFTRGSTTGTLNFTMPTRLQNGTEISGEYSYTLMLDNEVYATATAKAGDFVKGQYNSIADGKHLFGVYCTYDGHSCDPATTIAHVGNDIPLPPTNVRLTETSVQWTAPTAGVNDGFIDTPQLRYNVKVQNKDGDVLFETSTSQVSCTYKLPTDDRNIYTAIVTAECHGFTSEPARSNNLVAGTYMSLPMRFAPTADDMMLLTVADNNHDGVTWSYYYDGEYPLQSNSLLSGYTESQTPMDDYIFLPAVYLDDPERLYQVSLNATAWSPRFRGEYLEVVLATSPDYDGVIQSIIDQERIGCAFDLRGNQVADWDRLAGTFKVMDPGVYYIGIHCNSAAGQAGVLVRNIEVLGGSVYGTSPQVPQNIVATAAKNGELKANVLVRLPRLTMEEKEIPDDETLTATVKCQSTVTVSGKPGERVTAEVETLQGDNTISVIVANSKGHQSPESFTTVFTGEVTPEAVDHINGEVSDDMRTLTLTWECPKSGVNGGYINPGNITYNVYRYAPNGLSNWTLLENVGKATSYTFRPSKQDRYTIGIEAVNAAGGSVLSHGTAIVGPAYKLPMTETFQTRLANTDLEPWVIYDTGFACGWTITALKNLNEEVFGRDIFDPDNDTQAMIGSGEKGQNGRVGAPRFETSKHDSGSIVVTSYTGELAAATKLYLYSTHNSEQLYELGTLPFNTDQEFQTTTFTIPEKFLDEPWVQLLFQPTFRSDESFMALTNVTVNGSASVQSLFGEAQSIMGLKGKIAVNGLEGSMLTIATPDGRTVYSGNVESAAATYSAEPGIYMVKAGKLARKVLVK